MKIAIIGNFDKEISPISKGGTELFTYSLASGLALLPDIESINVFGVGKNYFENEKINFIPILPQERIEFTNNNQYLKNLSEGRTDFDAEFRFGIANKIIMQLENLNIDLIHDNSTSLVFTSLASKLKVPIITTMHTNVMSPSIMIPYSLGMLDPNSKKQYFISIAEHQIRFAIENNININIFQTVYNGLDISKINFISDTSNKSNGLWLGRVKRKHNKGLREAVQTAKEFHKNINIVMQVDDKEFYSQEIEPNFSIYSHITPNPVDLQGKNILYGNSSYFLYPIQWEEPFGLVFIESMASGTPVIAFAKGAVPEVIKDGITGFIVNPSDDDIRGDWLVKKTGLEGLNEAIEKIQSMTTDDYLKMRKACRDHVEKNFTIEKMVNGYEKVYEKVIQNISQYT